MSVDLGFWGNLAIDALITATPSTHFANKIAEPYRRLPFGQYLHQSPPRRQRTLTGLIDPSHASVWQRLHVLGPEQRTADQSTSAFLSRLPLDVRLMIYDMLLGGMTFHLTQSDQKARIRHHVCQRPDRINDRVLHAHCFETSISRPPSPPKPDSHPASADSLLPLLLTCRKVYSEAIETLYSANVFEFSQMSAAFRFLRLTLPPQRLPVIRHFRLYMRVPRHPSLNSRTRRDWLDLFTLFSRDMPGLRSLNLYLDFLQPVTEKILCTSDDDGAEWIQPMLAMAVDADRKTRCCTEIVTGGVTHDLVRLYRRLTYDLDASDSQLLWATSMELHRRIRSSLEPPD